MNLDCAFDCGPSATDVTLLLSLAMIGVVLVRRSRWWLIGVLPCVLVASGYAVANEGWGNGLLNLIVFGSPVVAALWPRHSRRPA